MATPGLSQGEDAGILRTASPEDLFNLPLYEHHLVLDIRPLDEYERGHIASAVSYPSPLLGTSEEEREAGLIRFVKAYVKEYLRPENPSPVVVYSNNQPETIYHAEWLARKLIKLQQDRKTVARTAPLDAAIEPEDDDQVFNHFEHFCLTIADSAREIWIMEGGYEAFRSEYEFLCGHVEFAEMYPLPHQIARNLFLGTRVFPVKSQNLAALRITHMVLSEYQNVNWEELHGITVLKCAVRDIDSQDMLPCWTACTKFINEATVSENSRVLVLLFGRSRSTSVILAYLIKNLRMSFEDAWEFVRGKCWHLVDRSLVYEEQLRVWARMVTGAIGYRQDEETL